MTMRISATRIDMDDKTLQKPVIKDYGETLTTDNSSTSYTIDLMTANVFKITMTGNCTFTFSNPPASGTAGSFTLILIQDGTGFRTATWPASVKWPGGIAPTLATTATTGTDILTFITTDGGTIWYGLASAGASCKTTVSAAGEWNGATGSFTFTGDDIACNAAFVAIRSDVSFTGDFTITFTPNWTAVNHAYFGLYPISEDGTFNQNNEIAGTGSMTNAWRLNWELLQHVTTTEDTITGGTSVHNIKRIGSTFSVWQAGSEVGAWTTTSSVEVRMWIGSGHSDEIFADTSWKPCI